MPINNDTKKTTLGKKYNVCKTLLSKACGLMFKKHQNLIFVFNEEKIIPLHMWFVFYPIDIIYLNQKKQVVELKENFRPFTLYKPQRKAQYVIELKAGIIRKTKTKEKDIIVWN
ncbi:DUF192 domain-containing protein [Candidatus Woesearchaeota archaeon]|nr:DUF192 domain-containing protein [Candidatus Woesearchaeota archaeon]